MLLQGDALAVQLFIGAAAATYIEAPGRPCALASASSLDFVDIQPSV